MTTTLTEDRRRPSELRLLDSSTDEGRDALTVVPVAEMNTYQKAFRSFSIESLIGGDEGRTSAIGGQSGITAAPAVMSSAFLADTLFPGTVSNLETVPQCDREAATFSSAAAAAAAYHAAETDLQQHFRLSAFFNSVLEQQQRAATTAFDRQPLKLDYFKAQQLQSGKTFAPRVYCGGHRSAAVWPYVAECRVYERADASRPPPPPPPSSTALSADDSDDADDDTDDADESSRAKSADDGSTRPCDDGDTAVGKQFGECLCSETLYD